MRLKVQPMNVNGRALIKSEGDRRETFFGELNVYEIRVPRFERAVMQAPIIEVCEEPTPSSTADPGRVLPCNSTAGNRQPRRHLPGMALADRIADSPNQITP